MSENNSANRAPAGIDPARVEAIALRLTSWGSETGSAGEAAFADRLIGLLQELPYFRAHPEDLRLVASHGEPLTRNVVALVRGRGRRTLALAGHFDTVSTDNYHELRPLACDSLALKAALIDSLSAQRTRSEQEERALADLVSGDFLPGRGLLDMKSGLAVAIACLERFAENPEREGNLLFLTTPDEERESRGMRSLRNALPALVKDLDIEICGALNLDVTSDQGEGEEGRAVFAGTIGKLLPFALVVGLSSHAAYPFEGVSAQAIGAGILAELEGNADLSDRDAHDISPPPICLEAKDLRDGYEVTTPERFWLAFNWLYHAMSADELFTRFRACVEQGASGAVSRFADQAQRYSSMTGRPASAVPAMPRILSIAEVRQRAEEVMGTDFAARYEAEQAAAGRIDNPLIASRQLATFLVDAARLSGPAVVIGFAGLHYPASRLELDRAEDRALQSAIDQARLGLADDAARRVSWKPCFQGISDMSFLGLAADSTDVVSDNTPVSRLVDRPPASALRFPAVNLGPWGREFHQKFERVQRPYAFAVLPDLVMTIAREFLAKEAD
ncbi:peptidase M20 [Rhizobium sp. Root274]|uniref:M20/M25/M40 family metallo-hydrolase n=1 Tax=unclassified Rhizobium TaxID=2613769 RepID=UPI0007138355|nr:MULTISPECIES: M20/M25/M40 family metallo-hydrolase [unclassified Rhizobium]KQW29052.1 peptidase M20 [Rhizobium sp. Root1240]KRD29248.1 peptidase M20 [Rhizobium sp. Root274]